GQSHIRNMSWILGFSIISLSLISVVGAQCYDCNYLPGTNGGFPACGLATAADTALVSQVTCSSNRCFIRQDSNGFIYRGCGDVSHLPFGANTALQCATQAGSVWYFCTGALCNSGQFTTVCPTSSTISAPATVAPTTVVPVTVATTVATSVNCYDCTFHPYSYSGYVHHQTPSACAAPSTVNGVAQTPCSEGRCFVRRDANGDIYRGCGNVANLPFGANVNLQCATQAGSVWYFCSSNLCNSVSLSSVCPTTSHVSHTHHSHHHGHSHGHNSHVHSHHAHAPSYPTHQHSHATYNNHHHHQHAHAHSNTHAHGTFNNHYHHSHSHSNVVHAPAPAHTSNTGIIYVNGGTYPNLANYVGLPTHGQSFVGHGSQASHSHSIPSSNGIVHVPAGQTYPNLANYVAAPAHNQPVFGHGKK
ncbi:unnamed protein product, partial [Owenia fusiformis]